MIEFQIREMVKAKGLKSPYRTFLKLGIGHEATRGYMTGKRAKINRDHLEILCTALRCTPNDLFGWTPDTKADDYPENPLQAIRKKPAFDLEEKLKGMSLEEIKRRLG